MAKHSLARLFVVFAAAAVFAVLAIGTFLVILRFHAIEGSAEREAAALAEQTLLPILMRESDGLDPTNGFAAERGARFLISDGVTAVRIWEPGGQVLASAGQPALTSARWLESALRGDPGAHESSGEAGDVLVSYTTLSSGLVVELQQDYEPVAETITQARQEWLLHAGVSAIALLLLLPAVLWVAIRGFEREYMRLRRLHHAGQAIRSSLDLADVIDRLSRDATEYAHAQIAFVALIDEKTNDLVVTGSYDRETDTSSQHHRRVEEWYMRRSAATGETVQTKLDDVPYIALLGYEPKTQGRASLLSIAVPGRERAVAVMVIIRAYPFRAPEVRMLEEMAVQGAMAVEQALLFAKVRSYAEEVELSYDSTLKVLMAALDTKDTATQGHSERVSRLTVELAKEMGVPKDRLVDIERGALLHDVGKIGVPDDVLRKPDSLDDGEWEAMQKHPLLAGLMVSKVGFLEGALPILLYHHERYDGSGYPFGLAGKAIPLEARIFTVVDSYDAMTSERPYRDAMAHHLALQEIRKHAGIQFDPDVVDAFCRMMDRLQPPLQQAS